MDLGEIKGLLLENDPEFWKQLTLLTGMATEFDELFFLSSLRKKAVLRELEPPGAADTPPLRLAILGGCSLYPAHELVTHLLVTAGVPCELFLGDYDNYVAEIMEAGGDLYRFRPQVVLLLPGLQRCKYPGLPTDTREAAEAAANAVVAQHLNLCRTVHERTNAEVVLGNFMLPARHDAGEFRSRTLTSDWNFRKWVNLQPGLNAPSFVRICDPHQIYQSVTRPFRSGAAFLAAYRRD
jgi:hypothetical protein